MHESSLYYIKCVQCQKELELKTLKEKKEIIEGFLHCKNCKLDYPIISKIPILWNNFTSYLTNRKALGGNLILNSQSDEMKKFVKKSLSQISKSVSDRTPLDQRWVNIYLKNKNSKFYSHIKKLLTKIPRYKKVLEHGCSVGYISKFLAKHNELVFGIDSSYLSVLEAKKNDADNLDFFVADSIFHPFGQEKFGLIVALNMLELVEPCEFLASVSKQLSQGTLMISDPYDYQRGEKSVKKPLYENELRKKIQSLGLKISYNTIKPNKIPWKLILNPRTTLNYKVDVILAKKL